MITLISSYFSNPAGLVALAALIPLAIFYLVKKEPEEQVMPSFMFFHDGDEMESTKSSFRKVLRNLLLLLHILAILGFAAAFAEPYIPGAGTPAQSVLVIDRSASMSGDLDTAKGFLSDNLGKQNTVIAVDNNARVIAEGIPSSEAASTIERIEIKDTGTDIVSGLERAIEGEGTVFIASDLDQTADNADVGDAIERLESQGRRYEKIDLERRNSWGVVGIEIREQNTSVQVKNFESRENTIDATLNGQQRQLTVEGETVHDLKVQNSPGRNIVKLEKDGFEEDNRARFYIPEEKNFEVTFIADRENPYLMKAFELIDFTDINYRKPPIEEDMDADIYIVGEAEGLLSETVEKIDEEVRNGKSLVIFGHQEFEELGFDLPVKDNGGYVNRTVRITDPLNIDIGTSEIRDVEKTGGERLTPGTDALVISEHGAGDILFYNIRDRTFNQEFMYPVFWEEISNDMVERAPTESLNYETGENLEEKRIITPSGEKRSGRIELENQGFYNTSRGTVAVNMLNEDESLRDTLEIDQVQRSSSDTRASAQHLLIALVLLMIMIEAAYLYRIGDIR